MLLRKIVIDIEVDDEEFAEANLTIRQLDKIRWVIDQDLNLTKKIRRVVETDLKTREDTAFDTLRVDVESKRGGAA